MLAVDLPMPVAMDLARGAVFARAVEATFSPEYYSTADFTDISKMKCRRLTARRVGCSYRFTIYDALDRAWYEERGRTVVSRTRQSVLPTPAPRATRDGATSPR